MSRRHPAPEILGHEQDADEWQRQGDRALGVERDHREGMVLCRAKEGNQGGAEQPHKTETINNHRRAGVPADLRSSRAVAGARSVILLVMVDWGRG
jgi:hypothetical protein